MIPWTDHAVLILEAIKGERSIDAEGTLSEIVRRLDARPAATWNILMISLPDRRVPPFGYASSQFRLLIDAAGVRESRSDAADDVP